MQDSFIREGQIRQGPTGIKTANANHAQLKGDETRAAVEEEEEETTSLSPQEARYLASTKLKGLKEHLTKHLRSHKIAEILQPSIMKFLVDQGLHVVANDRTRGIQVGIKHHHAALIYGCVYITQEKNNINVEIRGHYVGRQVSDTFNANLPFGELQSKILLSISEMLPEIAEQMMDYYDARL